MATHKKPPTKTDNVNHNFRLFAYDVVIKSNEPKQSLYTKNRYLKTSVLFDAAYL